MELLLPQPEQAEMVICKGHRLRENRSWDQGSRDQSRPPGPLPAPSPAAHSLGTTPGSSHVERPCPRCSQLSVSHTPGWRFERAHPLKQTATGRKCVPLLQLSLYENHVLQGGSQRLLRDNHLKNSSNLIPPSILESERPSHPSRGERASHHQQSPHLCCWSGGACRARQTGAFHLSFHDIECLRMCGCPSLGDA